MDRAHRVLGARGGFALHRTVEEQVGHVEHLAGLAYSSLKFGGAFARPARGRRRRLRQIGVNLCFRWRRLAEIGVDFGVSG
ncbi:MAG: hypothetical protein IPL39_17985 [Opitutaceae bacterium]|nr:hypothetical protein [Opitutaceae bacterium]